MAVRSFLYFLLLLSRNSILPTHLSHVPRPRSLVPIGYVLYRGINSNEAERPVSLEEMEW